MSSDEQRQVLIKSAYQLAEEITQLNAIEQSIRSMAFSQLGRILITHQDYNGAEKALQNAITLLMSTPPQKSLSIPIWITLAELNILQKKYKAAEKCFKYSMKLSQQNGSFNFLILMKLGRLAWISGNQELGMESTQEAIVLNPNSASARWLQGLFHLQGGNAAKAIKSFQNAKSLEESLFVNLGLFKGYVNKGDKNNSKTALARELELQPNSKIVKELNK